MAGWRWEALVEARRKRAGNLETAESIAAFDATCEETAAWMRDKAGLLDASPDLKDSKALHAMQRRHKNLERELRPVEEKMGMLKDLANQAHPSSFPSQGSPCSRSRSSRPTPGSGAGSSRSWASWSLRGRT